MFKHLFFLLLSLIALKLPAQDSLLIKADQHLHDSVLSLSRPARLAALPYFTGQIAKRRKSGEFTLPLTKSYYLAASANLTEAAYLNTLSYIDTNIMLIKLDTTNFSQNRLAYSQYIKGITYQGIGSLKLALDFGEKAVANLKSALEQGDSLYTAYEYGYILEFAGRMAYQNGDFPLAYHRLSQVDELMKTAYVARTDFQAKMTRASALLQEEKIEEATRILLDLQDYPFAKQSLVGSLVTKTNLAIAYSKSAQYDKAEAINQDLAAGFEELLATTGNPYAYAQLVTVYTNMIHHENLLARFSKSQVYFDKAVAYAESYTNNRKGTEWGGLFAAVAVSCSLQNKFSKADSFLREATYAFVDDSSLHGFAKLPRVVGNSIYSKKLLLEVLEEKRAMRLRSYDVTGDINDLKIAHATSFSLDTIIRLNRDQLNFSSSINQFATKEAVSYEKSVDIALRLYLKTDDPAYLNQAYQFVSRQKSNLLLSYLGTADIASTIGVPAELVADKSNLELEILVTENQLPAASPEDLIQLREKLLDLNYQVKAIREQLEKEFPEFTRLLRGVPPLDISKAAKSLQGDQLMVEYFLTQDSVYLFTLSKEKGLEHLTLERPDSLLASISQIAEGGDSSSQLFQQLLEPALVGHPEAKRIQIIPDGILWKLPFQALKKENDDFLIQDYAISYAYAAHLIFENSRSTNFRKTEERFIGFGISYEDILKRIEDKTTRSATDGALREMGQLPFARKEVLTSAKITGGKYFIDGDATKNTFLQEGANGEILHLSMHGLLHSNPMESALVFRGQEEGEYDLLTMQEVLSRKYSNKLTILSACHTGDGPLETSEGMLSMGRAFTFAGSESTITSSWAAHDEITHDVLVAFYERLRKGASKDVALQEAIKDLLINGSPSDRQATNWANLTLIGPVAPIYGGYSWSLGIGIFALVLGLIFVWWRRK